MDLGLSGKTALVLVSRHRSSVGLRWPSKRIAALHRLPIRSVLAAQCALRCAPMAARSPRHLIPDATLTPPASSPGQSLMPAAQSIHALHARPVGFYPQAHRPPVRARKPPATHETSVETYSRRTGSGTLNSTPGPRAPESPLSRKRPAP